MKNISLKVFLSLCVLSIVASCTKKPDVEYTSTYKMSGEWYTKFYVGAAAVTDYHVLVTYNTANPASGQIWVYDEFTAPFKSKLDVDYNTLSFKAMAGADNLEVAGQKVKVYEGKVIPNAGRSKSGAIVDSIYLKVEFTHDPGTTYEIRGHQRTGFFEDEY